MRRVIGLALAGITVCGLAGCGGKHGATVNGKVLIDGQPLPENAIGTVVFFPASGGPPATGKIDGDSSYELSTGLDQSLPPGDYKVTIAASEPPATLRGADGGPPPPGRQLTPPKYRQSRTSGLQYTVENGGNTIDIELSSDAT